jgi:tRNA-Thr(GGU) m(6)t(6)A37 methyltransferase TsaA
MSEAGQPREDDPARPGEVAVALPEATDAALRFIGRIRTPFKTRSDCPRNILQSTAEGRVELDPRYVQGLQGLEGCSHIWLLYWMHEARRDLLVQVPKHVDAPRGTFALRSPVRPNPIAMAAVKLLGIEGTVLRVAHMDCLDGTPLLDIKPYFASIDSIPEARRP